MDKTQLPQDFGLFRTFFDEDYLGSSQGINVVYSVGKQKTENFWRCQITKKYKAYQKNL